MKKELACLLEKYDADFSEVSAYKHRLTNKFCQIDFLRERYNEGYVVVVHTPDKSVNLFHLIKESEGLSSVPSDLEDLVVYTVFLCKDILTGDYSRIS